MSSLFIKGQGQGSNTFDFENITCMAKSKSKLFYLFPWLLVLVVGSFTTVNAQLDSSYFTPHYQFNFPAIDAGHWHNAAQAGANFGCPNPDCTRKFGDWATSVVKNPSMYQATAWNQNAERATAWGAQWLANKISKPKAANGKLWNIVVAQSTSALSTLVLLQGLPFGQSWVHEEYHRAVMATHSVASRNPFDDFSIDLDNGSVSRVTDAALSGFKRSEPAAFNRMLIAGGEGELQAVRGFQEYWH